MLTLMLASFLMFVLLRLAIHSLQAIGRRKPIQDACASTRQIFRGSHEVEVAFGSALACCPEYATPLLEARSPCALLLARAASGDLDAMTDQIVEHLLSHIPPLVATHCAVIERAPPELRRLAMAELVEDVRGMAAIAQGRLDFLAARRSEMRRRSLSCVLAA